MPYSSRAYSEAYVPMRMGVAFWILALYSLVAFGSLLQAQNVEGTILGTVKDPSGGVIAGATVRLTNQGTGVERSVVTDGNGDYRFTNSQVGSYVLSSRPTASKKSSSPNSICWRAKRGASMSS